MNVYETEKIRNIALISHSKAGKTSLAEAMLFISQATSRLGRIEDKNTVCDYDTEETKRLMSVRMSLAAVEWMGNKINIMDTPGYFDFLGDSCGAVTACDTAVITVSGKSGARIGGELAFKKALDAGKSIVFFINKMDHENADFDGVVENIRSFAGEKAVPTQIPIKNGTSFDGYIDIIENKAYMFEGEKVRTSDVPDDYYAEVQSARGALCEIIAESDDELLDKFFSEIPFTYDDLKTGVSKAIAADALYPILCGSALNCGGVGGLLNFICAYTPAPSDAVAMLDGKEVRIACDSTAPLAAQVFKTISDPFVGKVSLIRIYSGMITKNGTLYNTATKTAEKIGGIITMRGKEKIELEQAAAGDICAVSKLAATATGDTFATQARPYEMPPISFPAPTYRVAFVPKARGDEEKISSGLHKLTDEDKTLTYENNAELHQLIVSGLGDRQIDVAVSRLNALGTEVEIAVPKVSYREKITKKIQAEGKHKKQSGGHGQYGHVKIEFEPHDGEELIFEENIFGGSVPKNYHPAVEKGLSEMVLEGIQAGYKVVGLKATLYDGSYHDVDSSEMAFKMAAHLAFKELVNAGPIILEPMGKLEVCVPDSYTGDIMGDINKRRGRVLSIEPEKITAIVPMSEMSSYTMDLRSMTQGRGSFTLEFDGYEQAAAPIAKKIIEESQK